MQQKLDIKLNAQYQRWNVCERKHSIVNIEEAIDTRHDKHYLWEDEKNTDDEAKTNENH